MTIEQLVEAEGDPDKVGAILLGASLFSRVESSRGRSHSTLWPDICIPLVLIEWIRGFYECRWEHLHTDTLPEHGYDYGIQLTEPEQVIAILAMEHARVLHRWVPVHVRIGPQTPDGSEGLPAHRDAPGARMDP